MMPDLYTDQILALAANMPRAGRLAAPDRTAKRHSKLCGSTITVDLCLAGDRVTEYAQDVQACLLGQSAAALVGREIIGSTAGELRAVADAMRAMLKSGGAGPDGRWRDLRLLAAARDYPARHASTLLVFDALETALAAEAAGRPATAAHTG